MKKIFTFTICVLNFTFCSIAQSIQLSQFFASDQLINPAKTGDFEGDYRVTGNYRNQWQQINSQPLTTSILAVDKVFHYYSQEIDGGILVARDEFSGFNTVTSKILLSLGYSYKLKGNNFRFGIQPGIVFNSTNLSTQTFPDQWDYSQGSFNLPSQENSLRQSQNYFDLNTGVQWSKRFKKLEPKVGFALDNINRPKDSYFASYTERLAVTKVFDAQVDYHFSQKFIFQPKLFWMWTTNVNDMVAGANVKYLTANKVIPSIFAGVFYRQGIDRITDAIIPMAGFSYKRFNIGLSYDVNVSSLSSVEGRKGTFEFSVIYIAPSSKSRYITLPCDRY